MTWLKKTIKDRIVKVAEIGIVLARMGALMDINS
jgi:hypothetical protein